MLINFLGNVPNLCAQSLGYTLVISEHFTDRGGEAGGS